MGRQAFCKENPRLGHREGRDRVEGLGIRGTLPKAIQALPTRFNKQVLSLSQKEDKYSDVWNKE